MTNGPDALDVSLGSAARLLPDVDQALARLAGDASQFRHVAESTVFIDQDAATSYADWARQSLFDVLDARQVMGGWLRAAPKTPRLVSMLAGITAIEQDLYRILRLCSYRRDPGRRLSVHQFRPIEEVWPCVRELEGQEAADSFDLHRLRLFAAEEGGANRWVFQDIDEACRMRKADLVFWRAQVARWRKAASGGRYARALSRMGVLIGAIAGHRREMMLLLKDGWQLFPLAPEEEADIVARLGKRVVEPRRTGVVDNARAD